MKKLFVTILMMGAFALGIEAQNEFFVVATGDKEVRYDYNKIDSIVFLDRSKMEVKADTIFDIDIRLPYDEFGYGNVPFTLPAKKLYKMFGYSSAIQFVTAVKNNEVYFYFYSQTTKEIYSEDHSAGTANGGGCWFNETGDVCGYGDNSYLYVEPNISSSQLIFVVGQYPARVAEDGEYTLMMGLQNGDKYVAFRLHVTIGEIEEVNQQSFVFDEFFEINETGYEAHVYDIDTTGICSTFGMTLDELIQAIGSYDITLYPADEDDNIDKSEEMLDMDGYWFNANGAPCMPDDENATIKVEPTYEGFSFSFSQAPYKTSVGDIFSVKVALCNADVDVILTFNLTVVDHGFVPEGFESDGKNNITVYKNISNDYASVRVAIDAADLAADLGYATVEDLIAGCTGGDVTLVNLNADLSDGSATANNGGAWYDADGNTIGWGADARVSNEPNYSNFGNGELNLYVYNYPGTVESGDVFIMNKKAVGADGKESFIKLEVHINY